MKDTLMILMLFCTAYFSAQQTEYFNVDGSGRTAIIFPPKFLQQSAPVVFVFHGHGGNARMAARRLNFQEYFPEALVVFMQGLPGRKVPGLDPDGTKNGWQIFTDDLGRRDIHFFDVALAQLKSTYHIDAKRVYIVGHSNGGRFVNVLWKERAADIAAVISVSGQGGDLIQGAKPVSVWMSMGKDDLVIPFSEQKKSIPVVMENLGVDEKHLRKEGNLDIYSGKEGTVLVVDIHTGGHEFPGSSIPKMVSFLRNCTKK